MRASGGTADALASGASVRKGVGVQIPPCARTDERPPTNDQRCRRKLNTEYRTPKSKIESRKSDTRHPTPDTSPLQLTGRTHCDRIVVFDGNPRQIGYTLPVTVYDANAHTLFGEVVTRHSGTELFTLVAPTPK